MRLINCRKKVKKIGTTFILILVISIISLTVAYAALSETLTISGSGTVNASTWDINIANSSTYTNTSTGSATFTTPTVSDTTISYTMSLTKPGDSITLYFDVTNDGDLQGEITSIINSTPTCTSSTGNTADASLVCNNLDISLTYASGTAVSVGDVINTDSYTCTNGSSSGSNQTYLKLAVILNSNMTSVPTSNVTINNLKHTILYSQTNKTCSTSSCFVAGTKVAVKDGYKNIEDIKAGEYVYSYNLETKEKELNKVVKTFEHKKDEIYTLKVNNQIINTTEEHPFYVQNKGWINASNLMVNDKLYSPKKLFAQVKVNLKQKLKDSIAVYNIEVEDNHNYFVSEEEILVHNKGYGGATPI